MKIVKKRRKRQPLKTVLLVMLFVISTINCEKEITINQSDLDSISQNSDAIRTEIDYISGDDDPEILDILSNQTLETSIDKSLSSKSVNYKKTYIDLSKIMKVKNGKGITNYGMNLYLEDGVPNEFYNVVINESAKGKKKDAYIVKYSMTPENHTYFLENGSSMLYFKGTRTVMSFDSFYSSLDVSYKSERVAHECDDIEDIIDNTGNGEDGFFVNIVSGNSIIPTGGYTPAGPNDTGYNSILNGYDHIGQRSTSYIQRLEFEQELFYYLNPNPWPEPEPRKTRDIPGTSPGCFASSAYFGSGSTSLAFTRMYASGGSTFESFLLMEMNDHEAKPSSGAKTSHEELCPGEEGEIPIMIALGLEKIENIKDCVPSLTAAQKMALDNYMTNGIRFEIFKMEQYAKANCEDSNAGAFIGAAIDAMIEEPSSELNSFMFDLGIYQDTKITFSALWDNYEDIKSSHYDSQTNKSLFSNYCAINLSHALLKTGVSLNSYNGASCWGCQSIENNGEHAIRAEELANWLKNSNIDGVAEVVTLTGENFKNYISGKKGMVFFKDYWQRDSDSGTNRTGDHIDLWDGNELASSNFFMTWFRLAFPDITESIANTSSLYKSKTVLFWQIQ